VRSVDSRSICTSLDYARSNPLGGGILHRGRRVLAAGGDGPATVGRGQAHGSGGVGSGDVSRPLRLEARPAAPRIATNAAPGTICVCTSRSSRACRLETSSSCAHCSKALSSNMMRERSRAAPTAERQHRAQQHGPRRGPCAPRKIEERSAPTHRSARKSKLTLVFGEATLAHVRPLGLTDFTSSRGQATL
jgi:hypothetical protein